MKATMLATLMLVTASTSAHALGKDGHETVCYIAYSQVASDTRQRIDALIKQDPEYGKIEDAAEAFASSCNWADDVKPVRWEEHFVNVPRGTKKIKSFDCPEAERCLLSAIVSDLAILKDTEASSEEKLKALKYMGHWVGDLHQPLHVSFKDHKGGNDIKLKGIPGCDNLHSIFDTCVIQRLMDIFEVETSQELAQEIIGYKSKVKRTKYRSEKSITKWANEIYGNARFVEAVFVEFGADYCESTVGPEDQKDARCKSLIQELVTNTVRAPNLPTQLRSAGIGLAELLDKDLILADG